MRITNLKTNHIDRPLGFGFEKPVISWQIVEAKGTFAKSVRAQVTLRPDDSAPIYDSDLITASGKTDAYSSVPDSAGWELPVDLKPCTRYYWHVYVQSELGEEAWSEWTWFETPKDAKELWAAQWIGSPLGRESHPVFTKRFTCTRQPESARLYILGLGMYEAYLNGEKLGSEVLSPGFHAYDSYLMYQTLELYPKAGENVLEVWLGEGWYMGHYGLKPKAPRYGDQYALLCEAHLRYPDGSEQVFGTDDSWLVTRGQIESDSIYDGEVWNATLNSGEPQKAVIIGAPGAALCPRINPLIEVHERIRPTVIAESPYVLDFGQNFAGWCEFECDAPNGTRIQLEFAEYMKDGDVYRDNLRTAKQTFTYVSDGVRRRVRPHFTYFGFRYVRISGWQGALDPKCFEGCAIYSSLERTGYIETTLPQLNRLYENTLWSQKSNFIDVPTDCPQRDERMGWTGDIQVFADTASFHMDTAAFLSKFMRDLGSEQARLNGSVPCVVPMCRYELNGVAAWGDAACVIPWQLYLHTGDKMMLREQLPIMRSWVDWITRQNEIHGTGHLWDNCPQLGDWLALDGDSVYGGTDRSFVATAYYYYSALLTSKAAKALGEKETEARYCELAANIRNSFRAAYFTPSGNIAVKTQTACVMSLYLGLVPEQAKVSTQKILAVLIRENGCALSTGFVGTPWLLSVLCASGETALAYDLLLRQEYPGWMYELNNGATTIWERWNSIEPDGSMNKDGMNSFNHYAYGSVAGWMYRFMAGINPMEEAPGFRKVMIAPKPDRRIQRFTASYASVSGKYCVEWAWNGDQWTLKLHIPFGCSAKVVMPDGRIHHVLSGEYAFSCELTKEYCSLDTSLDYLLKTPETREIISRLFPGAIRGIPFQYEMHTLRQLVASPFAEMSDGDVDVLAAEIGKCEYHT